MQAQTSLKLARISLLSLALGLCVSMGAYAKELNNPLSFSAENLISGKMETIDFKKAEKGTVLVFLSAKCPCSLNHEPRIAELAKKFKPKGFKFFGIHSNKSHPVDKAKEHFQKEARLPFPVYDDSKIVLAERFSASATPHAYVVSPEGKTLFRGGVDSSHDTTEAKEHYLMDALDAISSETPKKYIEEIFVLGCAIDR